MLADSSLLIEIWSPKSTAAHLAVRRGKAQRIWKRTAIKMATENCTDVRQIGEKHGGL
jgi:hypothetical protein